MVGTVLNIVVPSNNIRIMKRPPVVSIVIIVFLYGCSTSTSEADDSNSILTPVDEPIVDNEKDDDGFLADDDCDDNNSAINPDAVWYLDADGDSYADAITISCCTPRERAIPLMCCP